MKYFLLFLLCVFYTTEGLAQVVREQYEKYQVDFGQEIAVRRTNGGFSNAVVTSVGSSDYVDVKITEPDGTTVRKRIDLSNRELYSPQPLRSPAGHLRIDERVSFTRTDGTRSEGLVEEIRGKKAKVVWTNKTGSFYKWVDINDVDRPMEVTTPLSPNRRAGRTGIGRKLLKHFRWGTALIGAITTAGKLFTEGFAEAADHVAENIHDVAGGVDLDNGDIPVEDYLQNLKTSVQRLDPNKPFSQERQGLNNELRSVRRQIREDESLTNEEKQQYLRTIGEIIAIVQPPSPPRNPPRQRRRRASRGLR